MRSLLICAILFSATLCALQHPPVTDTINMTATNATIIAPPQLNATNATETNMTGGTPNTTADQFKDGDSINIESSAVARSYLYSDIGGCKDKKAGETCGNLKGFYGPNQNTRFVLRKGQANSYCLQVAQLPNIFAIIKDVKNCNSGDWECGSGSNIAGTGNQCQAEYSFIPLPIQNDLGMKLFAFQAVANPNVYLRLGASDCASQIGNKDNKSSDCGYVKGRYASNVSNLMPGDYEVFRVVMTNSR
jgi:hypothetical protein